MLMVMTVNGEGAAKAGAPEDSREAPDGSADTLEALVGSSDVPLAALDLPSGQVLAVNPALADALGSTVSALAGSNCLDLLPGNERHAAQLGFQALADGDLSGYQAIRTIATPDHPDRVFSVWVSTVDWSGTRVGLASVIPAAGHDSQFRALPPTSMLSRPGNIVLGTVDGSWRVNRISQDVTPLLGLTPEQCVGRAVLGVVHPSDAPAFLAAVEHARRGERAVRLTMRLSARSHDWTEVNVVLATLSPDNPPPLAFALIRDDTAAAAPEDIPRESQLETHMLRIADELRAAGLIPRLERLPVLADSPDLGKLTSREWAVLTRLLDGQRVSAIAADLYVSQSTVRNHLSSIYAKLGVHSQVDLIRLVRHGTQRPANERSNREGETHDKRAHPRPARR
jgi:DNA-binding CsgD family transcriptional regulator